MYIILKPVKAFSKLSNSIKKSLSSIRSIESMRHLRNKDTGDTKPTVVIDHEQTAHLALLNGIRSTPTIATPMPSPFHHSIDGVSTQGNDGDYNATHWGHEERQMTISQPDFTHAGSEVVRKALEEKKIEIADAVKHDQSSLRDECDPVPKFLPINAGCEETDLCDPEFQMDLKQCEELEEEMLDEICPEESEESEESEKPKD